tara:strand:+ start:267 stop:659 length:393 start_codon:yes stop_codon:yes gene_type:complete
LKHGLNPEVLRIRDLDSFWEPSIEPEIQRMRHEVYSRRRHEMMKICRAERKKLLNMEAMTKDAAPNSASLTPAQILAQQQKQNSTLVENEERRLAKMRRRQEKELEQMLQFEVRVGAIYIYGSGRTIRRN